MYISRIKLVNFIGIYIGQQCETFEIHMDNRYPITLIRGENGFGKSVLISAMASPFAYDGGFDNRSSVSIIRQGQVGEKEIDYIDGRTKYTVHHFYRPNSSGGHSVKSYITKDGVELNSNGNVSSFEPIISSIFGITEKDLMLIRVGTNTTSFVSLPSTERKKHLSRLIGDINIYMILAGLINGDIRSNRNLMSNYIEERNKLGIVDIDKTISQNHKKKDRVQSLLMDIGKLTGEKDSILSASVDVSALVNERNSLTSKIGFIDSVPTDLKKTSLDTLREQRKKLQSDHDTEQAKVTDIRSTIDSNSRGIDFAEIDLRKLTIDDSISEKKEALTSEIESLSEKYKGLKTGLTSKDYNLIYQEINNIRTLLQVVTNYETKIVQKILEIYTKDVDVEGWYEKSMLTVIDPENKLLMEQHIKKLLLDGYHIPECSDVNCVYRRFGEMISSKDTGDMTIDFITSVKQGIGVFMRAMDLLSRIPQTLPKQLLEIISKTNILDLTFKSEIFSIEQFDNFRSVLYGFESYKQKLEQLEEYKRQESSKKQLIIMRGDIEARIRRFRESNESLTTRLVAHKNTLFQLSEQLEVLDVKIGKRIEYDNIKDEYNSFVKRLKDVNDQIESYSTRQSRVDMLNKSIRMFSNELEEIQIEVSSTDTDISLYKKYQEEVSRLDRLMVEQNKILRTVSARKEGIPLVYMKIFFDHIRKKCNELLDISYNGSLILDKFDLESPVFNIPYIKNGHHVKDIKVASQGEDAIITAALSFAMSSFVAGKKFNILLCDEMDSTLDVVKKYHYLDMLDQHITVMNIDQCIIISHSEALDSIPTNLIDMQEGLPITRGSNRYKILRG